MAKLLLVCLLLASSATAVPAQSAANPQDSSPAMQQFRGWLAAFNSGDRETMKQFLEKNRPDAVERLDQEMGFRRQTGGFEIKKIETVTDTSLTAILKERASDQFGRLEMEVDAATPHHITKLGLRAIGTPGEFSGGRTSGPEAIATLRAALEKDAAADRFSGAALVAENGKAVFEQAYGMADRDKRTPNQVNTKFRIGSMNKMFTAVAVLQLVQAGKVQLTDPLSKFIPDYGNQELASKVTIHHLLTHTGGTGDIFGPEFEAHRLELKTLNDYVKLYEKRPLQFEPGSRWEYSNYGFVLLGVVIERATGQSYYDYVRERVFKTAGMLSTDSLPETEAVAGRSIGYTRDGQEGAWSVNTDTLPYRGSSAGGGYSTVEDLLRFANALQAHKLLDAEHTEMLVAGKVDTPHGDRYGYGFMEMETAGLRCYGHGGGAPGMNGDLRICPQGAQGGYVIAVLANLDPPAAQRAADLVANRLPVAEVKGR
jgi:CubicO group peptidase (beta-lactamase class C family)